MKQQIKLTNAFDSQMTIFKEPDGTPFSLMPGSSVIIDVLSESSPAIDIKVHQYSGQVCLSIWPEAGRYDISD